MEKSVKIIVLGDSGVGKTSLVHLLCYDEVLKAAQWTVGCRPEVLVHPYKGDQWFVELWDVGGAERFIKSRHIFYNGVDGILLVHDLTNAKSYANLRRWLRELLYRLNQGDSVRWREQSSDAVGVGGTVADSSHVLELLLDGSDSLPVLIMGCKADAIGGMPSAQSASERMEGGGDSVDVSALDATAFREESFARVKLNAFFDKVIEHSMSGGPGKTRRVHGNASPRTSSSARPRTPKKFE